MGSDVNVVELTPQTLEKAFLELNENPQQRQSAIAELRSRIQLQSLQGCIADEFLLRFLRAKKFNCDNALRLYINYYILRIRYPDIFNDLRPSLVEHVFRSGVVCRLPQPDSEGRALIYFKPGLWNPSEWSANDIFRANVLVIEELLLCWPAVQVHGVIILVDLSGFYWKHAINLMSPWFLRCAVHFLQGSSPVRVKSVHIFNSPYIFSKIYSTLMPLLKPKNQARVVMHNASLESLHAAIPPHLLPCNSGLNGTGPPVPSSEYIDGLLNLEDYFIEMNKFPYHVNSIASM
ncbi:Alpha-tocopherol transfer protein-like isoform 2 [Schistosoma japonicum]|uniref:Alpha-tocopherol transfer protein-like isoform 2 n=1 Tax=Schistosoma japonicum TaxID=6182 RepID=Q5DG97_SCHJA|nr:SJCHGC05901 protein [Schistosoma japonicum]TNN05700.1 Alpha-tocopherol transfer protein-like isoform 2 [Schistosoma japonicum]TNN05701.1 Alpha-tocopherol transfer protein-like isoform 2 [Schistosoma japonicum]TNN05702.1 Alpha-tocopherol transfer protein-like isoform 2 [Schistosoma japonicum]TNN05703.1 Alpha-tocopherol transfer protein-like isoform 2 [Schistosoma japonicum]